MDEMTSRLKDLTDNLNNFNSPAQHLTLSKSSKSATTKSNFWWDPPHALGLNFLREYLLPFALFGKESWYSGQAAQRISFFDKFQSFLWFLNAWNINARKLSTNDLNKKPSWQLLIGSSAFLATIDFDSLWVLTN